MMKLKYLKAVLSWIKLNIIQNIDLGGNLGLLVMGGDSCSEGQGFETQHRTLDEYFFTYNCSKDCKVCLKKTEKTIRGRG